MLEAIINSAFVTTIAGPDTVTSPNGTLFLNGAVAGVTPTFTHQGTTQFWTVTFTPTSTGIYTLFAFGAVQFRIPCETKSTVQTLKNIEDEALGSWSWDKTAKTLTVLRKDGTTLATYTASDDLLSSSRELISITS